MLGVLNRKYPPLEHAGDFAEDGERVGQVFEDVVGENQIEGGVGIGDAAGVGDFAFVQHRVIDDAGIEVDAADPCGQSPEVHLLDDARARAEVENDRCGGEALEISLGFFNLPGGGMRMPYRGWW